jgi:hypothetical protein
LHTAANLTGWVEILFAFGLVALWRHGWPLWITVILMLAGIPVVALSAPAYLTAAFNPLRLNLGMAALALTAIVAGHDLPSASRCRREARISQS